MYAYGATLTMNSKRKVFVGREKKQQWANVGNKGSCSGDVKNKMYNRVGGQRRFISKFKRRFSTLFGTTQQGSMQLLCDWIFSRFGFDFWYCVKDFRSLWVVSVALFYFNEINYFGLSVQRRLKKWLKMHSQIINVDRIATLPSSLHVINLI